MHQVYHCVPLCTKLPLYQAVFVFVFAFVCVCVQLTATQQCKAHCSVRRRRCGNIISCNSLPHDFVCVFVFVFECLCDCDLTPALCKCESPCTIVVAVVFIRGCPHIVSVKLFSSSSDFICVCLCICLWVCLSICICVCLCICLWLCLCDLTPALCRYESPCTIGPNWDRASYSKPLTQWTFHHSRHF